MNSKQEMEEKGENPGAGAGKADNFAPREEERLALEKNAGYPGSADHAAGMHGGKTNDTAIGKDENASGQE